MTTVRTTETRFLLFRFFTTPFLLLLVIALALDGLIAYAEPPIGSVPSHEKFLSVLSVVTILTRGDWATPSQAQSGSGLSPSPVLEIGESVIAIGNPLALKGGSTVTVGVVSAVDRSVLTQDGETLYGLIQTDAAINPGNSGTPLTITASIMASFGLEGDHGVLALNVDPGGRAAVGDLQNCDIITTVDQHQIYNLGDLWHSLRRSGDQPTLQLTIQRKNAQSTIALQKPSLPKAVP